MEISEIRIVYDPKGTTSSSISSSSSAYSESASLQSGTPYPRVSTAANWPTTSPNPSASTSPPPPPSDLPFPRPLFSSSPSSARPATPPGPPPPGSATETSAGKESTKPTSLGLTELFILGVIIWQVWETFQLPKEKQKEEEAKRASAARASDDAPAQPSASAGDDHLVPADATSGSVRKANSLELWVNQQKRLNRSRLIQRKLERGLNQNERDAVFRLCLQSVIDTKQAREILASSDEAPPKEEGERVRADGGVVSIRKLLAEKLGSEVQVRDYAVVKTTLQRNTAEANEWLQESRLTLQSRTQPSRSVLMNVRTRIVETKEKPSMEAEEGLILVENRRDLLQEILRLARPSAIDQQSDSRIATYVEKVDMTFEPNLCLEFEFGNVRIS